MRIAFTVSELEDLKISAIAVGTLALFFLLLVNTLITSLIYF